VEGKGCWIASFFACKVEPRHEYAINVYISLEVTEVSGYKGRDVRGSIVPWPSILCTELLKRATFPNVVGYNLLSDHWVSNSPAKVHA
jgi:hypothetical protein